MCVCPVHNRAGGSLPLHLLRAILALMLLSPVASGAAAQERIAAGPQETITSTALLEALEYFRLQKFAESAALLAPYVETHPTDAPARRLLAECYLKTGQPALAIRHLREILRQFPDDRETRESFRVAEAALRAQREMEARKPKPEDVERWFVQAERLAREKKLKEAEELLSRVLQEQPDHPSALLRLAEVYSATGRFLPATMLYQRLAEVHGAPRDIDLRLARNFAWGQQYGQACRSYARYLGKFPQETAAVFELAEVYRWSAQPLKAIPRYRQVLEREPQRSAARAGLALALQETGQHAEAVAEFDRALESDPDQAHLRDARVRSQAILAESRKHAALEAQERGDYQEAIRLLERHLSEHPEETDLLHRLARLYSWCKDYSSALRYYERFLNLQPGHLEARLERAEILNWTKDFVAARRAFAQVLDSAPNHQRALEGIIHAHHWAGELEGVDSFLVRLETVAPGHPLIQEVRKEAEGLRRSNLRQRAAELEGTNPSGAIQVYRQYLAQYASDREMELRIARLYAWSREYAKAIDEYLGYLQRYPQDFTARLELADVQRWHAQYPAALQNYSELLSEAPHSLPAMIGRAEALYASSDDPFAPRRAYRQVLGVHPQESLARRRYSEIQEQLRPEVFSATNGLNDSDEFARAWQQVRVSFLVPQRYRVNAIFRGGYARQRRLVPGSSSGIAALNQRIGQFDGTLWGGFAGIGVSRQKNGLFWNLETTAGGFDDGRASFNWAGEFSVATSERGRLGAQFQHEEAGLELNTLSSLAAGIKTDAARVHYQHQLFRDVLFSTSYNLAHFSARQRFAVAGNWRNAGDVRLTYRGFRALHLAYSYSAMGYRERSPLYFSPDLYHVHRAEYWLRYEPRPHLLLRARGSAGYGWIEGAGNFEFTIGPELSIRVSRRVELETGYLFGRSRSSSFGSPIYRVHNFFLSLRFPVLVRTP